MKKVSVIGAGHVGATTAHLIALKGLADVVLLDIVEGLPQGKALDMMQARMVEKFDPTITGTNDYKDTADSDIIVVTAGLARKPGMTRKDLLEKNSSIISSVIKEAVKHSPDAIFLIVTNPLDGIVMVAREAGNLPKSRIFGMSGGLDSSRFRHFIARELKASPGEVHGIVIGAHSTPMVPLASRATVGGKPLKELLPREKILEIIEKTRHGGAEIVGLLKTGSAFYAPASAITEIVETIVKDLKRVLPCSVLLEGEYGADGIFMCVPACIGANGVEGIVEYELDDWEKEELKESVEYIRDLTK